MIRKSAAWVAYTMLYGFVLILLFLMGATGAGVVALDAALQRIDRSGKKP